MKSQYLYVVVLAILMTSYHVRKDQQSELNLRRKQSALQTAEL